VFSSNCLPLELSVTGSRSESVTIYDDFHLERLNVELFDNFPCPHCPGLPQEKLFIPFGSIFLMGFI
jgi:hypothetical protein